MASTSSQPPSSSTTTTKWDVFLSFRGLDTRNTFTSHLYSKLLDYSIQTFKDEPELRCGEVISDALLQAIQVSKIYIVVLSENYASSSWCLDELVEIIRCSNTMERLVIPVFYNILPSVVRYQNGSFEEHFKTHEDRLVGEMERVKNSRVATQCIDWLFPCFTTFLQHFNRPEDRLVGENEVRFSGEIERVKNWRLTLRQVADKSGKHIGTETSEADIVNEILDEILLQIKPTVLHVAEYPVGLPSRVQYITSLLSSGTEDVIKIGIYGMGGVGKTTLAKAVFNDQLLLGSFKGGCFLENVRENSGKKGIETLQQQLINDVLKSKDKVEVTSVAQGTMWIKARICSTKILVVIDDLEDHKIFKSLVGPFASGSVVIITTRDEEILDTIEVEPRYRYRVNELGEVESETLFLRHALGDTTPDNTQMILSKHILRLAGGLPLALKVFGSYLYKKSEDRWKSYIDTLQRNPNSTIQERLMISLNALESDDPLLKKMFLDIACFFIGRERKEVVEILDTYYSYAEIKIDILMKKSLLTINDYNRFQMHDLLQDVGKEIARNNSPDEPAKHSRLWKSKDIYYVLEEHKGTATIEAVMLHYSESRYSYKEVSVAMGPLKRMSNLRFLFFRGIINLTGKFKLTAENLRWFCWEGCPLECLPIDFYPKELVTLELPGSKMTTLWDVNMVSNAFKKLKTLNMSSSKDLTTTPDFRRLPCLEKLNLEGCTSLKEVHNSIGSLVSLVSLNLKDCKNLRSLPDTICNMRSLEILKISGCDKLERLPDQLWKLSNLKSLYLDWCRHLLSIAELPPNLTDISANYCTSLERLNLSNLKHLEEFSLYECSCLTEISGLGELTSLKKINLKGCDSSMLARTLTKALFQIYSGFEQSVTLRSERFPNWIIQSSVLAKVDSLVDLLQELYHKGQYGVDEYPYPTEKVSSTVKLQPNLSHNYLGMILCFVTWRPGESYSVMTSASNILQSTITSEDIVIVPRSIFAVTDADHTIKFTSYARRHWIRLLYKNEDDSTTVHVEDERNNLWASDLEV